VEGTDLKRFAFLKYSFSKTFGVSQFTLAFRKNIKFSFG